MAMPAITTQNRSAVGVVTLIAAAGMMAGLLGAEIKDLDSWVFVTTPSFVGKAFIHLASVIGAFIAGQLVPTSQRLSGE